jgi:hypothetical protein
MLSLTIRNYKAQVVCDCNLSQKFELPTVQLKDEPMPTPELLELLLNSRAE